MRNGHHISCEGKCVDVSVKMQGLEIYGECFLLELGGLDTILGVE